MYEGLDGGETGEVEKKWWLPLDLRSGRKYGLEPGSIGYCGAMYIRVCIKNGADDLEKTRHVLQDVMRTVFSRPHWIFITIPVGLGVYIAGLHGFHAFDPRRGVMRPFPKLEHLLQSVVDPLECSEAVMVNSSTFPLDPSVSDADAVVDIPMVFNVFHSSRILRQELSGFSFDPNPHLSRWVEDVQLSVGMHEVCSVCPSKLPILQPSPHFSVQFANVPVFFFEGDDRTAEFFMTTSALKYKDEVLGLSVYVYVKYGDEDAGTCPVVVKSLRKENGTCWTRSVYENAQMRLCIYEFSDVMPVAEETLTFTYSCSDADGFETKVLTSLYSTDEQCPRIDYLLSKVTV